jgi:phospholipase C
MNAKAHAIEHVIMVVFENRSFDHVLGWMSHPSYGNDPRIEGLTGPIDANRTLLNPQYGNPALMQTFRPFFVEADEQLQTDLPHGRVEVSTQLDHSPATGGFAMRGFAASYFHENPTQAGPNASRPDPMRMLTPPAIPVTSYLAQNFMVCDHWFTPIATDTHPNRMMAIAGYSEIEGTSSLEPDQFIFSDWADANGKEWRVYSDGFSFMSLMGKRLPDFVVERAKGDGRYRAFSAFAHDYQFDAAFPTVTMIEPAFSDDPFATEPNDNHPPLQMGPGEALLLKVYNALTGTAVARERFAKTLVVVYYDEHGGFYDHIPPLEITTPSGRLGSPKQWQSFSSTGPRVPAIVLSPRVSAGVFKGNLDHTSVLRFLGERFGKDGTYTPEVTARHASGVLLHSLGDVVDLDQPRSIPSPPAVGHLPTISRPGGGPVKSAAQQGFQDAREQASQIPGIEDADPDHFFVLKS